MKKKGGQILRVGKEKVTLIFDGMLFPIGCANIPHNKQPIEHVLKIPISKPGDRDKLRPPLYRKVGCQCVITDLYIYNCLYYRILDMLRIYRTILPTYLDPSYRQ